MAAAKTPHLLRAIAIAHFVGLRPGVAELYRLKWSAIDFDARTIRVISAKKGGLAYRDVPIAAAFNEQLRAWYDADGKKDGGFIIQWRKKPVATIKTSWRNAKRRAGITRRLRPYDCRHAFASAILRAGGDLKTTSRLLGHTRTETTTEIYQHIDLEMGRTAVEKLPDIFPDAKRPEGGNVVDFAAKRPRSYKKYDRARRAENQD
jgi:integrase